MSSPPSDFLLEQFDAIMDFFQEVKRCETHRNPRQVKQSYYVGFLRLEKEPELFRLCQELEKVVPFDHPFWSSQ